MEKVKLSCQICSKEFEIHPYRKDTAKFCSRECQWKNKEGQKLSLEHREKISLGLKNQIPRGKIAKPNFKKKEIVCCDCGQTVKHIGTQQIRCKDCRPLYRKNLGDNWRENNPKTPPKEPVNCEICNKIFKVYAYQVKKGEGKYCSKKCLKKGFSNLWQNKEYKERMIKASLKGLIKRPTSLEKDMINLIKKHNLPYKYTGNGSFLIGYKNPDFININGEKKLIEVGNFYHHQGNYIQERREHFAKYGWKSFIFIGDKLDETKILKEMGVS